MQKNRIDNFGLINRKKTVSFKFNNQTYTGYEGDTLASALLANGVTLVARSFKYHRPRGIVSAGSEEPNALVTLFSGAKQEPNVPATMVSIYNGLEAHSQNCFPSVKYDYMAINNYFSSILVAGFYYKTFMGFGQRGWHFFEHFIRKAAGQGQASNEKGQDKYEQIFDFCDVLVIGGGVSGLASALSAERAGKRVIIVDEKELIGGYGLTDDSEIDGQKSSSWVKQTVKELENSKNVKVLPRTVAFGLYDQGNVGCVEKVSDHYLNKNKYTVKQRMRNITADKIILATGAIERPLVFANNDLPNVMQAEALNTYINQYGVCSGESIVIFTNNDSAYRTVQSLLNVGKTVSVIDIRNTEKNKIVQTVIKQGANVTDNAYIKQVNGSKIGIKSVDVIKKSGTKSTISCDLVASSGGHTPVVSLWSHLYGKPVYNTKICAFVPASESKNLKAVGACVGKFDLADCLKDGYKAGGDKTSVPKVTQAGFASVQSQKIEPLWEVPDKFCGKHKKFVDQQHDVSSSDVKLAHREGYRSVELLKRYTTLGMANDQGKTSNVNALAQMADLQNQSIQATGTTVFRPPYSPVSLGSLAGSHTGFNVLPERFSPFHNVMLKYGAENFTAGLWYRPRYFPKLISGNKKETLQQAYIREAEHIRKYVGVCDVGTLGKIDVQGPDAAEFLNRIYTNAWLKLPVGKARYGLMLREDGIIDDDGTSTRLGENHFLLTTTTVKAADVLSNMERYLETQWQDLKVTVTSVSDQTGTLAVAGPNSRDLLQSIVKHDISNKKVPEMATILTSIDGVEVRLTRLSFSGEMAFEVFVNSNSAEYIYNRIMKAGKKFNIIPYGMECLGALRIEKGFITHAEINGTVNAKQIGYAGLCSKNKWFVGKDMLGREGMESAELEMVGILPTNPKAPVSAGGHFVKSSSFVADGDSQGYISSMTYSPVMKSNIGLGFLKNGRSRIGEKLYIADPLRGNHYEVEVVDSVFYDKEGVRTSG